jgi:small conductance mechanosensitive channel
LSANPTIVLIAQATGTIVGSYLIAELMIRIITRAAKRAHAPPALIRTVREGLSILWVVLAVTGVLSLTGVASEFSALTVSGLVGLAVSLALQTTLSNMISGVLLFNDGALRLNDVIEYNAVKGKVVKLALRNTWVRMDDGNIAIIGNSSLSSGPLVNLTAAKRLEKKL